MFSLFTNADRFLLIVNVGLVTPPTAFIINNVPVADNNDEVLVEDGTLYNVLLNGSSDPYNPLLVKLGTLKLEIVPP